jgi:7,8-dihydroneopterin aldolase/epimerase/oxygenase
MENIINIQGIRLYAYHGCLEEEAKIGGNYVVDVRMVTDFMPAAESDELESTIDYCAVYEICRKEMAFRNKLIEAVCARIFKNIKRTFPSVTKLNVKVTKLVPPMNGDVQQVSVEMNEQ